MQPINSHYQAVYSEGKQSNDEQSDYESSYYSDDAEISSGGDSAEYRSYKRKQNPSSTTRRRRNKTTTRAYRCMNCNRTYTKGELQSSMMIVQEKGSEVIIVCCPGSVSSELCPPIDANLGARRTKTTYSVIYPGQNREDPQLLGTTQKRKSEAEFGHPATKRRRINEKRGEMYHEMTLASNTTKPDEQLLQRVKDILKTKSKSQKELAREIKVSQTKLSQYLNRGYRTKGWQGLEEKLQNWVNKNIADRGILPATEAAELLPIPLGDPPKLQSPQVYMQHSFTPDNAQEYYQALSEHHHLQSEGQYSFNGEYGFTNTSVNNSVATGYHQESDVNSSNNQADWNYYF